MVASNDTNPAAMQFFGCQHQRCELETEVHGQIPQAKVFLGEGSVDFSALMKGIFVFFCASRHHDVSLFPLINFSFQN